MVALRGVVQADDKRDVSRLAHKALVVTAATHAGKVTTILYKSGKYVVYEDTDEGRRRLAIGRIGEV